MTHAIGESKKKIYTIPEGEYRGIWHGYMCWLYKEPVINPDAYDTVMQKIITQEIFARFDTKTNARKSIKVKVIINSTKAKIYENEKTNKTKSKIS